MYLARGGNPTPIVGWQKKPRGSENWRDPRDSQWAHPLHQQGHICTQSQETETPEAVESKSFILLSVFSDKTLQNFCNLNHLALFV